MTKLCLQGSRSHYAAALIVVVASVGSACSSGSVINIDPATGGTVGGGGTSVGTGGIGAGGASSNGGGSGRGGQSGSGGSGAGGAPATGGAPAVGGANAGGTLANGGSHAGGTTGGTGGVAGQDGGQDATASGGSGGIGGVGGTSAGAGGSRSDASPDSGSVDGGGISTYNPCPASGACAILPLGDSITWGYGASGADGGGPKNEGGYRIELFRQTVTNTKNINFIGSLVNGPTTIANKPFPRHNEGHGGFTIAGIAAVVRPSGAPPLLTTYKPDIVLLKIGTNDVNGNNNLSNAPTRLADLINTITTDAPSALVVVSTIIPILNDSTNVRVQTYNAAIPDVVSKAAAAGKHVIFVDAYTAFVRDATWKTKLMFDNLHPNDAGYIVLGQMWYAAMKGILPTGP